MYWDAKSVTPLADHRIYVELEDGRRGVFGLKPYLDRGVMRELRDRITSSKSALCLAQ